MGFGEKLKHIAEDVGKGAADVALGAVVVGLDTAAAAEQQTAETPVVVVENHSRPELPHEDEHGPAEHDR